MLVISSSGDIPDTFPTRHRHGPQHQPQDSGSGPGPSDTPMLVTGWMGLTLLSDTRLLGTDFLDVSIFALMTQANNQ